MKLNVMDEKNSSNKEERQKGWESEAFLFHLVSAYIVFVHFISMFLCKRHHLVNLYFIILFIMLQDI